MLVVVAAIHRAARAAAQRLAERQLVGVDPHHVLLRRVLEVLQLLAKGAALLVADAVRAFGGLRVRAVQASARQRLGRRHRLRGVHQVVVDEVDVLAAQLRGAAQRALAGRDRAVVRRRQLAMAES